MVFFFIFRVKLYFFMIMRSSQYNYNYCSIYSGVCELLGLFRALYYLKYFYFHRSINIHKCLLKFTAYTRHRNNWYQLILGSLALGGNTFLFFITFLALHTMDIIYDIILCFLTRRDVITKHYAGLKLLTDVE